MKFLLFLVAPLSDHQASSHPIANSRSRCVLAFGLGRREALQKAGSAAVTGFSFWKDPLPALAEGTEAVEQIEDPISLPTTTVSAVEIQEQITLSKATEITRSSFAAYSITADPSETLSPSLHSMEQGSLIAALASSEQGGTVWLGEHHDSKRDHSIQADLIRKLHQVRGPESPMAVGLEQVQVQFQPVLDDYVDGNISLESMRSFVEWDTRWIWRFENYQPIFEMARELKLPLVALNVDSEDLAIVEKSGLPGLEMAQMKKYISDPYGFAEFAKPVEYRTYVNYVIKPSYDIHEAMGLLQYTISGQKLEENMSFRNFFSGRILWDEAMASRAYAWTTANPGGLMIGLVGADHVKFKNGIPGRYTRMAGTSRDCTSVILNPTLIDTTPPGSMRSIVNADSSQYPDKIILQLRYLKDGVDATSPDRILPSSTGGVLPLADYIVVS